MLGLRERLLQIRETVSPRRINEAIRPTVFDAEKVLSLMPPEIIARTDRGESKIQKRNRFLRGINSLIEDGYSMSEILQMDEECVDNQGRINVDRLQEILQGKYDD